MKAGSRSKGFGRRRRGRESGPAADNPFAQFDDAPGSPPARAQTSAATSAATPTPALKPAVKPRPAPPPRVDPSLNPRTRAKPAAVRPPGARPRKRLRRVVGLTLLFVLVMPAMPVLLLRFVPPLASAMMLSAGSTHASRVGTSTCSTTGCPRGRSRPRCAPPSSRPRTSASTTMRASTGRSCRTPSTSGATAARCAALATISQQVAKNLFLWPGRSFLRKVFEAWFTFWIEWLWPKERILEVYLNIAELGDGVFGAEAAARRYFKHPAVDSGTPTSRRCWPRCCRARSARTPPNPSPYLRQRQRWILRQI